MASVQFLGFIQFAQPTTHKAVSEYRDALQALAGFHVPTAESAVLRGFNVSSGSV